jgi:hypothetical protein
MRPCDYSRRYFRYHFAGDYFAAANSGEVIRERLGVAGEGFEGAVAEGVPFGGVDDHTDVHGHRSAFRLGPVVTEAPLELPHDHLRIIATHPVQLSYPRRVVAIKSVVNR